MITQGTADNTHAIIITLIPFQIPTSVITSPNHIKNKVQPVMIVIAINIVLVSDISIIVPEANVFIRTIIQYD